MHKHPTASRIVRTAPVTRLTPKDGHYFYGYYDKSCWDSSGRWIIAGRSAFMDRPPTQDDTLEIGLIDTHNANRWQPLASTRAWNWQQGCMAQWLGNSSEIIFNDRDGEHFIARVIDVQSGKERRLPYPVYSVAPDGSRAVSLNFSRLQHQRPGYGYAGIPDPWQNIAEPEDDGLWVMDTTSGEARLVLCTARAAHFQRKASFDNKMHRFNHAQYSANSNRFAVLHRCKSPGDEVGSTRLLTLDSDGSNLRCLTDHTLVSHYDWYGSDGILAWANRDGIGPHYYYLEDKSQGAIRTIGEGLLDCDGHCSFSPDRRWVLTDTYPDKRDHHRTLLLYNWHSGERIDIGRFLSPPMLWEIRCDLHPRWSRDGRHICIDSIHEGFRGLYLLDVSAITAAG